MVVYTLLITVLFILICVYSFVRDFTAPEFLLIAPFWLAICNLVANVDTWDISLNWNTYNVIVLGICFFLLGSLCSYKSKFSFVLNKNHPKKKNTIMPIEVKNWLFWIFAAFELLALIFCVYKIMMVSRRYGVSGTLSVLVAGYRRLGTFTIENISLGFLANHLYSFVTASGYITMYLLINNLFFFKKINKPLLVSVILCIIMCLAKGGRQSAVQLIVSGIVMYLIMSNKSGTKLKFRTLLIIGIIGTIMLTSFQYVGTLIGRNVRSIDFTNYIFGYLSAPIRNLDQYLRSTHVLPDVFGKMTFVRLINYLGSNLHIDKWVYELDLPFIYYNGKSLGNVYTTFYAYIYDFGYIGVPIMMFIMGITSRYLHNKAYLKSRSIINVYTIIYSFISYTLAFSFFSNKYYEAVVSMAFVIRILDWILLIFILKKIGAIKGKSKQSNR